MTPTARSSCSSMTRTSTRSGWRRWPSRPDGAWCTDRTVGRPAWTTSRRTGPTSVHAVPAAPRSRRADRRPLHNGLPGGLGPPLVQAVRPTRRIRRPPSIVFSPRGRQRRDVPALVPPAAAVDRAGRRAAARAGRPVRRAGVRPDGTARGRTRRGAQTAAGPALRLLRREHGVAGGLDTDPRPSGTVDADAEPALPGL